MSQVDIYAELLFGTAQARGEVKDFTSTLTSAAAEWGDTKAVVDVQFKLPDGSALQQMVAQLVQNQAIDIPVRFVHADGANGSNGTPSAPPPDISAITPAIEGLNTSLVDLRDEIADLARQMEAAAQSASRPTGGRARGTSPFDEVENPPTPGGPPEPYDLADAAPSLDANGNIVRGRNTVTYRMARRQRTEAEQRGRDARAAELREIRQARQAAELGVDGTGNGSGYDGGPPPTPPESAGPNPAGGRGHGAGGRGGLMQMLRAHPSLGQYFSSFGALFAAEKFLTDSARYRDAGFGKSALDGQVAREDVLQESIRGIPFLGGLAGSIADMATSVGGVSGTRYNQYVRDRAEMGLDLARGNIDTKSRIEAARSYNPLDDIDREQRDARVKLDDKYTDAKYHAVVSDGEGGWKAGHDLTSEAERAKALERGAVDAEAERKRRDYGRSQTVSEGQSSITRDTLYREGFSDSLRTKGAYGRDEQIADANAAVDENLSHKKKAIDDITDPRKKFQAERDYAAEASAAEEKKAAQTAEMKRKFAAEDIEIAGATAAATAQASGNGHKAELESFQAAWNAKLSLEQDANKKVRLLREKTAEESAITYKRDAENRRIGLDADAAESRAQHRNYEQTQKAIAEGAMDKGEEFTTLNADGTRTWKSDAELSKLSTKDRKRYDDIRREESNNSAYAKEQHDDSVRGVRVRGRQAELRAQGRDSEADFAGTKEEISNSIRDALRDNEMRPAAIYAARAQLQEQLRQGMTSQTFGSVADYATSNLTQGLNDPGAALNEMRSLIAQMTSALSQTGAKQEEAAQAVVDTLRPR